MAGSGERPSVAYGETDDFSYNIVDKPKNHWSGSKARKFGPSGNHSGMTIHAFAECHADFISDGVDRNVYLHRTTRDGGEKAGRLQ